MNSETQFKIMHWTRNISYGFVVFVMLWLFSQTAFAVPPSLAWELPTHRENGVELKSGELASLELQHALIPLDILTEPPVWSDNITLMPDRITYDSVEIELTEGFIGVQWRIRAVDSEGVFSAWADPLKIIPYSPIQKMILNIVNNEGSITINID